MPTASSLARRLNTRLSFSTKSSLGESAVSTVCRPLFMLSKGSLSSRSGCAVAPECQFARTLNVSSPITSMPAKG